MTEEENGIITRHGFYFECSCGNEDQNQFDTIVSSTGYIYNAEQEGTHGMAVWYGVRCDVCGAEYREGEKK